MRKTFFVDDAKYALKWISLRFHAVTLAFLATWGYIPQKFQDVLPVPWAIGILIVLVLGGVAGSLIKQDFSKALGPDASAQ